MITHLSYQNSLLEAMGIERWVLRGVSAVSQTDHSLDALRACISSCIKCGLHQSRTQTVFGTGNLNADVLFIGEAPGAEEDKQGKSFVGRAGQLLTQMLKAIHLSREDVFIANILKCRPPQNRDPNPEEVKACTPYLIQQIEHIKPKLIVALGRIAAHYLLNTQTALSKLRGQVLEYNHIPMLVTFHPAYLLRSPLEKAKAYEDLLKIQSYIGKFTPPSTLRATSPASGGRDLYLKNKKGDGARDE